MVTIDELMAEYKALGDVIKEQAGLIDANLDIQNVKNNIKVMESDAAKLKYELDAREKPYLTVSNNAAERQNVIRTTIAEQWTLPTKTYRSSVGTVTLRITKSLIVKSKAKIVDFLVKNNIVEAGVSKFDIRFLRKFKDDGLIEDDAAQYEESRNVTIKLVGE